MLIKEFDIDLRLELTSSAYRLLIQQLHKIIFGDKEGDSSGFTAKE